MRKLRVAFVIPAYNEEAAIGSVVKKLNKQLMQTPYDYEIVVVNDGSKDNTSGVASKSGAKVIDHILNSGSGGATSTGLRYAEKRGFDIAVTLDADGQHLPSDAIKGVKYSVENGGDLLIGSRLIDSSGMSRVKVLGNRGLSLITYLIFGINVTDSQSGMRVFSQRALQELRWSTTGYEFCSEMLWRAKQLGYQIDEFPIKAIYTDYSVSKGQNNWNAFNIIKSLLKRRIVEVFGE